jgi:hypothetical protein
MGTERGAEGSTTALKVCSGGQTGVDRAALDAALELGLSVGGWCPAGRWAEDGPIPSRYPLTETPSAQPRQRTFRNVRDADATLVITGGEASPGTALTLGCARRLGRPVYLCGTDSPNDPAAFRTWLEAQRVSTLNVAGPRESEAPGIYRTARDLLTRLLPSPA